MTLEEKLGQLSQYSGGMPTGPGTGRGSYEEMIAAGQVGSFLNVSGENANRYQEIAVERSRLKIPLIFGLDVIHGYRTIFPIPLALSTTWDPALVERAARIAAIEARADGIRWTFSPMVDIARDARWGRITEGAGEDPYLGSAMARAYVRGYQGTSLSEPTSMLACLKHYVGYGAAEGGRDYNTTEIPERLLRDVYLPPFKAGLDEGAVTVMSAFNALNGVPTSANAFTLHQILRKEWQFKGFVVSDWTAIAERSPMARRSTAPRRRENRSSPAPTWTWRAIFTGRLWRRSQSWQGSNLRGRPSCKARPARQGRDGLFENPYAKIEPRKMPLPEHRQLAREAAEKSFVLLKNDGVLPLRPGARIALIGPLADSAQNMLGAWNAKGEAGDVITLRAALAEKLGAGLAMQKGRTYLRFRKRLWRSGRGRPARRFAILALGENATDMTGEAASRTELDLPGNQQELLEAVAATGKPVVLLVFSGRPLVLTRAAVRPVQYWQRGSPAWRRVRRLCGRLRRRQPQRPADSEFPAFGWAGAALLQSAQYRPAVTSGIGPDATGPAAKYRSRYIDQANTPLYPFGFGLSYTTFSYGQVDSNVDIRCGGAECRHGARESDH